VRVLLLGNSNDTGNWIASGPQRHEIVRDLLAEATGEPVEVTPRGVWPTDGITRAVEGWIEKSNPDVIYLTMASFWFNYPSVPLRARRVLRRLGPSVSDAGFRAAGSPRWGHNFAFRALRGALQRTVGGDTHFTPEEVVARITEVITMALRHEGVVLAIQGADGRTRYSHSRRSDRRQEARRQFVHRQMKDFCERHHVTYENSEIPLWKLDAELRKNRVGDGLHANEAWHQHSAQLIFNTIAHALADAGQPLSGRPEVEAHAI